MGARKKESEKETKKQRGKLGRMKGWMKKKEEKQKKNFMRQGVNYYKGT